MAQTNKQSNLLTNIELSIQISLSGLSFCVLQRGTKTISSLKHINFKKKLNPFEVLDQLKHLFNTEEDLQTTFNSVNIIHVNELSSLIPKPLFNEDNLADYLKFNSKILKSDFIAFESITLNESINVYVPYVNINNFIYEKFGTFTYKHFSTILIEQILLVEKNTDTSKMYAHICDNHFELIIVKKGKLILYNTFEYSSKEDFIYYVLFTAEQLELNPELLELIFIGNIDTDDELYTIAYKYIRFVFFGKREDTHTFNLNAQPKNHHSDFVILNSF